MGKFFIFQSLIIEGIELSGGGGGRFWGSSLAVPCPQDNQDSSAGCLLSEERLTPALNNQGPGFELCPDEPVSSFPPPSVTCVDGSLK